MKPMTITMTLTAKTQRLQLLFFFCAPLSLIIPSLLLRSLSLSAEGGLFICSFAAAASSALPLLVIQPPRGHSTSRAR